MATNYKLTIRYDGTRYSGWEHKTGRDTVQGRLMQVFEKMTGEPVTVIGAGRTDAGVHALSMVANVHLNCSMGAKEVKSYANRYLPEDIALTGIKEVSQRFHARYNAVGKTYCYTLWDGNEKPVFNRKYVWVLESRLDVSAMQAAAEYMKGTHDFGGFCKNPQKKKSTVRTIDQISVQREKDTVKIVVHGDGFLHHMVRIITGTLVEIGMGRMEPEKIRDVLDTGDRSLAGPTAPALGLCLMEIDYN